MNKKPNHDVIPEAPDKIATSSYRHYLGMVKVLERLKRQSDLDFGPKLMNKILDARHDGLISDEQAVELTDRVHVWGQKLGLWGFFLGKVEFLLGVFLDLAWRIPGLGEGLTPPLMGRWEIV